MSLLALLAAHAAAGPVDPPPVDNDGFSIGTSSDPVWVPSGSLTAWRAARDSADDELVEVAWAGDSTSFGQSGYGPGITTGNWPTCYMVRDLATADGYPDGGIGHYTRSSSSGAERPHPITYDPYVDSYDTGHAGVVSGNGTRTPHVISRPGSWVTWQGEGRYARLLYARNGRYQGNFTWSVDSGAVTGEVPYPTGPVPAQYDSTVVDLGSSGLHTIRLTAHGGASAAPPTITNITGYSGDLPAGTYYFVATTVPTTGGESEPSEPFAWTGSGGARVFMVAPVPGSGSSRVYRSTSPTGPYGLVAETSASNTWGAEYFTTTASVADTATNPPTSSTGRMGFSDASVDIEWLNEDGIVWHRDSSSGTRSSAGLGLFASYRLGLVDGTTGPKPQTRRVKLAINGFGINDQQNPAELSESLRQNLRDWVDLVRAAGASPVLCIPLYERANQKDTIDPGFTVRRADRFRQVHRDVAIEKQCALVDLGSGGALPGYPEGTDPHLSSEMYEAQAAYLWDNCLSL